MSLGEAVGDSKLSAKILRSLELVPGLVEPAQPRIEVWAAEKRVCLDCREPVLAAPGELLVEERKHFRHGRAAGDHRSAHLVPGLDLPSQVAGLDRVRACLEQCLELCPSVLRCK